MELVDQEWFEVFDYPIQNSLLVKAIPSAVSPGQKDLYKNHLSRQGRGFQSDRSPPSIRLPPSLLHLSAHSKAWILLPLQPFLATYSERPRFYLEVSRTLYHSLSRKDLYLLLYILYTEFEVSAWLHPPVISTWFSKISLAPNFWAGVPRIWLRDTSLRTLAKVWVSSQWGGQGAMGGWGCETNLQPLSRRPNHSDCLLRN